MSDVFCSYCKDRYGIPIRHLDRNKDSIVDVNGFVWIYDEKSGMVYVEGTLDEDPNSGYPADSLHEAIILLIRYGYFDEETDEQKS